MFLGEMKVGQSAQIKVVKEDEDGVSQRLADLGFIPSEKVRVVHQAPSGDPIAVSVRGGVIGLRRSEANLVEVVKEDS